MSVPMLTGKTLNAGKSFAVRPLPEWVHTLFEPGPVKRALFRVDAGRIHGLSYGHVSRCIVLARTLKDVFESEVLFLMRNYKDGVDVVLGNSLNAKTIPQTLETGQECEQIISAVKYFKPDWLVVDLPETDFAVSFYSTLKKLGSRVLFIDDWRFAGPDVDVILNSSILAPSNTRKRPGGNTRYFLGPEYFIFDPGIKVKTSPKQHKGFTAAVSFGGSDPAGLSFKAVKCLSEKSLPDISVNVILGPGFRGVHLITDVLKNSTNNICIIKNPDDIYPYFLYADLVVCAGGRTLYELAALKKPALAIASIEHEKPVVEAFIKQNLLMDGMLEWDEHDFYKKFICAVNTVQPGFCFTGNHE